MRKCSKIHIKSNEIRKNYEKENLSIERLENLHIVDFSHIQSIQLCWPFDFPRFSFYFFFFSFFFVLRRAYSRAQRICNDCTYCFKWCSKHQGSNYKWKSIKFALILLLTFFEEKKIERKIQKKKNEAKEENAWDYNKLQKITRHMYFQVKWIAHSLIFEAHGRSQSHWCCHIFCCTFCGNIIYRIVQLTQWSNLYTCSYVYTSSIETVMS